MDKLDLCKVAEFIGGCLIGKDGFVTGVTTDSRDCRDGMMFIGLKGERADGNDFASDFLKNGGTCAVVEKDIQIPKDKSVIRVDDTKKAIRDIAEYYRQTLDIDVVAVTGSVGKTSTKDMLGAVLSQAFKTYKTQGNFNNEIGVPLTVFNLDDSFEKAVIEMGMSNFGEISRLTKIAKPDVAVVTNIGTAHIGNLGSRENILKAKLEILEGLSANGLLVLNGDDDLLSGLVDKFEFNTVFCGIDNDTCDYVAYDVILDKDGSSFKVNIDGKAYDFKINVAGKHHIYNALVALACGLHFGMNVHDIIKGVASFEPTGMRQKEIVVGGVRLIEDCYNASTDSMKSSLETLHFVSQNTKSIAVLGDMLEQGDFAVANHREVGNYVVEYGIDALVCVGNDAKFIVEQAKSKGMEEVFLLEDNKSAAEFLKSYAKSGDVVLFKASRGMKFEEISATLQELLKG